MRTRDQQSLETAYKSVCTPNFQLKELYYLDEGKYTDALKKTARNLTAGAVGLAAPLVQYDQAAQAGSMTAHTQDSSAIVQPHKVTGNRILATSAEKYKKSFADTNKVTKINSITKIIETSLNGKIASLIVEAIESDQGDYRDIVLEISGDVMASSQEEANNFAVDEVKKAMSGAGISDKDMVVVSEGEKKQFPIKIRATVKS
jgi:hypothetical protein